MKNNTEIVNNAQQITVINDGQVRYPVITGQMSAWVASHGPITSANYEDFCADVECIGEQVAGTVGSAGMIDLCADLVASGAATLTL
jgi:hypothetical protein